MLLIQQNAYQFEILRDVCNKCHQDVQKKSKPTFSSLAGFDFGVPIPECLKNMTLAEEALIARIQTVIKLTKLKANRYCYTIDGPISFIDRTNSTLEVANVKYCLQGIDCGSWEKYRKSEPTLEQRSRKQMA